MPEWKEEITRRLASLKLAPTREAEIIEEVAQHLEDRYQALLAGGTGGDEARRVTLDELSDEGLLAKGLRGVEQEMKRDPIAPDAVGKTHFFDGLWQDIRFALRMQRKDPGFTAVAILTLALGIGANTAVYSLVDTILLGPLPYKNPEQLVVVSESVPQLGGNAEIGVAAGEYLDYRDRNRSFAETAAYEAVGFNLTGEGTPLRVNAAAVTASLFPLLGVMPRLGHAFTSDDERPGSTPVAVLSYPLWKKHYGSDAGTLGKTIKLDEKPYVVVGVMPPSFQFPSDGAPLSERVDLWVPDVFTPDRLQNRLREFGVGFIGRLKSHVSVPQAQVDVSNVAATFMEQYQYPSTVRVVPHVHRFAAYAVQKARPLLMLLVGAVACVLLIACANVANLLLARGSHRSHEMALRSALGAARRRLVGQCLVESLLLSLVGAGAGFALAILLVRGGRTFGPADVPRLQEVGVDPSALLFTFALSFLTTLLFGFVPAWRLSHASPQDCLKESTRVGAARGTQRLQSLIAVAEIAMALLLLIGGGLLLRSFVRVLNVPLGFRPQGLYVVRTLFDKARYPNIVKRAAIQRELVERVKSLPGVEVVATASHLPLSDSRQIGFRLEHAAPDDFHWAENSLVSPGYFRTMGVPIPRGRDFTEQDRPDTPLVAIINQTLARQYFPGQDSLGQRFYWGGSSFTIVGIAGDTHISALDADPPPMIYNSMFQVQSGASERTALLLRLASGGQHGQGLFDEVQRQVWSLDRDLPVYNFTTFETLISESVAQRRFTTGLILSFAVIALGLALVGLFGVMSYLVARRERELAIRMALGASRIGLYWTVLKRGAALATAGCAVGLVLFPLGASLLRATLYQTSPYDPITLVLIPALLLGVALVASYIPACRATKVDPMVALRDE